MDRRIFVKRAGAVAAMTGLDSTTARKALADSALSGAAADVPAAFVRSVEGIGRRKLGRADAEVSIIGIGGYHLGLGTVTEQDAIQIVRAALDRGTNFLDNCWDYNGGVSEERMGKALEGGYRQKAFLMTKIDGRTGQAARQQLEESLRRLKTDHLDLIQIHEVIRMTDPEQAFQPGNVIEVLQQARKEGKVRFIGFTGHKSPDIHLHMIATADKNHFTFDSVQMPLNVMDAHYDSFEKKVLPVLVKHNIGVLGMKPMGDGVILHSKTATPVECLHYSMNLPTSVVITGCETLPILQQALDAARSFKPLSSAQVAQLLAKTQSAAGKGEFEEYKTTHNFDGTFQNPQWLG